ncbi:hypothetical protein LBMAG30_24360 [Comamonadaceae bacterium]|nr:hypothetical protein LBMAG30_24360 [Comamonadaceae bacterium]
MATGQAVEAAQKVLNLFETSKAHIQAPSLCACHSMYIEINAMYLPTCLARQIHVQAVATPHIEQAGPRPG